MRVGEARRVVGVWIGESGLGGERDGGEESECGLSCGAAGELREG